MPPPPEPTEDDDGSPTTRKDVEDTFRQFAQLIHASQRPLPTQSGDGQYLEPEEQSGLWADLQTFGLKDVKTVKDMIVDKASGKPQDDRKMHMEEIMQLIAALPDRSANRAELTSMLLDLCRTSGTSSDTVRQTAQTTLTSFQSWVLRIPRTPAQSIRLLSSRVRSLIRV
jgi:hypothetical protein